LRSSSSADNGRVPRAQERGGSASSAGRSRRALILAAGKLDAAPHEQVADAPSNRWTARLPTRLIGGQTMAVQQISADTVRCEKGGLPENTLTSGAAGRHEYSGRRIGQNIAIDGDMAEGRGVEDPAIDSDQTTSTYESIRRGCIRPPPNSESQPARDSRRRRRAGKSRGGCSTADAQLSSGPSNAPRGASINAS